MLLLIINLDLIINKLIFLVNVESLAGVNFKLGVNCFFFFKFATKFKFFHPITTLKMGQKCVIMNQISRPRMKWERALITERKNESKDNKECLVAKPGHFGNELQS